MSWWPRWAQVLLVVGIVVVALGAVSLVVLMLRSSGSVSPASAVPDGYTTVPTLPPPDLTSPRIFVPLPSQLPPKAYLTGACEQAVAPLREQIARSPAGATAPEQVVSEVSSGVQDLSLSAVCSPEDISLFVTQEYWPWLGYLPPSS